MATVNAQSLRAELAGALRSGACSANPLTAGPTENYALCHRTLSSLSS